jgi:Scramblase
VFDFFSLLLHFSDCLSFVSVCVNCCAEGNPFTRRGCCKVSWRFYPASERGNTSDDAPYIGKVLKKPKSALVEIFTDASAFDIYFPEGATTAQKGLLIGTSHFINAIAFEEGNQNQ